MTKNQKIWLCVFLAMVLIPEILWGGIRNILNLIISYNSYPEEMAGFFATSFLSTPANSIIACIETASQLFGSIGLIFIVIKSDIKNRPLKTSLIIFLSLVVCLSTLLAWMSFYYLINTPQIG